uniref:Secreted protein n=1 Tax=Parascaris univalens TaxID=6257 RepID=A0A914ZHK1_PARUN
WWSRHLAAMHSTQSEDAPIPSEAFIDEPSLTDDEIQMEVKAGEDTEQLSEMSDDADNLSVKSSSRGHFSTTLSSWYKRIAPLIRNKKVRVLTAVNFTISIVNLFIFFSAVTTLSLFLATKHQIAAIRPTDTPCFYAWGPWQRCSATCRINSREPFPIKKRKIERVVQSMGSLYAPCPKDLVVGKEQTAPCNVHVCPKPLSSFHFSNCFYYDAHVGKEHGCYKIRNIGAVDMLIKVDVTDLTRGKQ